MSKFLPKRVLVLAPHTDDGEFGCGGSIARFLEEKSEVFCAAFSSCEQSVPDHLPKDILISEFKDANLALGVKKDNLFLFNYDVRNFPQKRQAILEDLIRLKKEIAPDLIRAFKFSTILCYEIPWNNLTFTSSVFIRFDEKHLNLKLAALSKYKSQEHRNYSDKEYIRALAHSRGVQIGARYAETFDVVRWVID